MVADYKERWSQHYDDWCMNNIGGREPCGSEHELASQYADEMTADDEQVQEDDDNG